MTAPIVSDSVGLRGSPDMNTVSGQRRIVTPVRGAHGSAGLVRGAAVPISAWPRPVTAFGMIAAILAMLSIASTVWFYASILLPVGRQLCTLCLVVAGSCSYDGGMPPRCTGTATQTRENPMSGLQAIAAVDGAPQPPPDRRAGVMTADRGSPRPSPPARTPARSRRW
jgi:hypothetical protein